MLPEIPIVSHFRYTWKSDKICGAKKIMLTAVMSGGKASPRSNTRIMTGDLTKPEDGVKLRMIVKLTGEGKRFCVIAKPTLIFESISDKENA